MLSSNKMVGFVITVLVTILAFSFIPHKVSAESTVHLNYVDTGVASGIPVIFVHAFPLNQTMWNDQVELLKKTARVITFDIRGLGKSKSVTPYTLEFDVDDLIGLMDKLKVDKAVVCGLSMGGFVAIRAIERNPDRFLGAVLADTKSEPDSDSSKLRRYQALKSIQTQGLPAFAESFLKASIAPSLQTEKPQILARAEKTADSNSPVGVSLALLAMTSRTDTTSGLDGIHIPTLVMQGEFDTVIPLEAAMSLHDKIKGSEFFIVPKAGHLSNLENPEAFNQRLIKFLDGIKR